MHFFSHQFTLKESCLQTVATEVNFSKAFTGLAHGLIM